MYLCKLVQVIYVRLLSWRLYSFFIGKNKKIFKKLLIFMCMHEMQNTQMEFQLFM